MGNAFSFLWEWGYKFLSFHLDFGDISFTIFDFTLGIVILSLVVALIRRILE